MDSTVAKKERDRALFQLSTKYCEFFFAVVLDIDFLRSKEICLHDILSFTLDLLGYIMQVTQNLFVRIYHSVPPCEFVRVIRAFTSHNGGVKWYFYLND